MTEIPLTKKKFLEVLKKVRAHVKEYTQKLNDISSTYYIDESHYDIYPIGKKELKLIAISEKDLHRMIRNYSNIALNEMEEYAVTTIEDNWMDPEEE